jgi:hypothetical protein
VDVRAVRERHGRYRWNVMASPATRSSGSPLCQRGLFPPVDDAPVLAVVKQTALDDGCGPALLWGVGNGSKNGLAGSFSRG